ncbi:MAG: hypothetical protein K2X07_07435 [Caulobacteraceae bacterium]|nr:hypothetical protein [Caulobacteraceae bacterium]
MSAPGAHPTIHPANRFGQRSARGHRCKVQNKTRTFFWTTSPSCGQMISGRALEDIMQPSTPFPARADDQHRLMERLASTQFSEEQAQEIIRSPDAYSAFLAEIAAGLPAYARRSLR